MAQTVSALTTPDVAWHGEAVTIGDVLGALSGIRRKFAQADAGGDEHPHARNCVMTLVGVATNGADEVEAAWTFIDPIEAAWRDDRPPLSLYPSGTWGPPESDKLVQADGREWHRP